MPRSRLHHRKVAQMRQKYVQVDILIHVLRVRKKKNDVRAYRNAIHVKLGVLPPTPSPLLLLLMSITQLQPLDRSPRIGLKTARQIKFECSRVFSVTFAPEKK